MNAKTEFVAGQPVVWYGGQDGTTLYQGTVIRQEGRNVAVIEDNGQRWVRSPEDLYTDDSDYADTNY